MSHRLLAALLSFTGIAHFLVPGVFERIVPPALGAPLPWVYASGVGELAGAAALAYRPTRKWGAYCCACLFVAVFPANIYMAVEESATNVPQWAAWMRLPLQIPLIIWAVSIGRSQRRVVAK